MLKRGQVYSMNQRVGLFTVAWGINIIKGVQEGFSETSDLG